MANTAPIKPSDLFKYWRALPHQAAAISELETLLLDRCPDLFTRDQSWFKTWSQSGKQEDLSPALDLIKEFEGCQLTAYPDPLTGGAPWTIGYGTTQYPDGRRVQDGDKITAAEADIFLRNEVDHISRTLNGTVPYWAEMNTNQRCSLISFAYNLGSRFYGNNDFKTISLRLSNKDWNAVPDALLLYRNPGTNVEAGLLRRRKAEAALWAKPAPATQRLDLQQQSLPVPYYSQRDSAVLGQAPRSCFSSSCAMLLAYMRPGALPNTPNADDVYLQRVLQFGDTTDAAAQIKALASFGLKAEFRQNCGWSDLESQLAKNIPIPCGFLHKGPSSNPSGGGHWLIVIGMNKNGDVIVNDPWGEMDVPGGTYLNANGAKRTYSRQNWGPRWLVGGSPTSGWSVIAKP